MLEIRFHGRGGQGTVLAAKIVADAVLRAGRGYCQAIPEFGVERRGAPVAAYARVALQPIRLRSRILRPDAVVLLDPALTKTVPVLEGLKPGGLILLNSDKSEEELAARWPRYKVRAVRARFIAGELKLGPAAAPLVNTAMAGAVCAALELCELEALEDAVRAAVPVKREENASAARIAFMQIRSEVPYAPA